LGSRWMTSDVGMLVFWYSCALPICAMIETYNDLIAGRRLTTDGRTRVLLGIIWYIDACQVTQYQGMNIEILKFTLSIFNTKCREKKYAWRPLGYIPNRVKGKGSSTKVFTDSLHVDSAKFTVTEEYRRAFYTQVAPEEQTSTLDAKLYTDDNPPDMTTVKAQDLHVMLGQILGTYKKAQDKDGIDWDLRHSSPQISRVSFVFFNLFLKVDGVEADKMCGQYGSKGSNVAKLCRACLCPTIDCDKPYLTYPLKSQEMICQLVKDGEVDGLRDISQQCIWNA